MKRDAQAHVEEVEVAGETYRLEAGLVAQQTGGSVVVRHGKSYVLGAVVAGTEARPELDHVPMTVHYRELMSAAGRIPGSYQRREVRATEHEILVCRLIDRTLRPLFPAAFRREVQVFVTVFAVDPCSNLTTLSLIAAAAAMHLSDIPHDGPAAGAVVRGDPGVELAVSCGRAGVVMAEGSAVEAPDGTILALLGDACAACVPVLDAMDRLREVAGRPKRVDSYETELDGDLLDLVSDNAASRIDSALRTVSKADRRAALAQARAEAIRALGPDAGGAFDVLLVRRAREALMRGRRLDGRGPGDLRRVDCEVGLLETNHGSARFRRGETQVLVSCTLGGKSDAAASDGLDGRRFDSFMVHYDFPPYCVGEVRPVRGPGRRETGHGWLAQRALAAVLPQDGEGRTIRLLSVTTDSNGSSSMAAVCGGSLALLDAGIPIRAPVAGVAIGLVAAAGGHVLLTDITGDEDAAGDMDLKVAGTASGITAVQLDCKRGVVSRDVLAGALECARRGRISILEAMAGVIAEPRRATIEEPEEVLVFSVPRTRVGLLIGPGGRTIRDVQSATGTRVTVADDGTVTVRGPDTHSTIGARARMEGMLLDLVPGLLYLAEVTSIRDYGVMVRIADHNALVHVSELTEEGRPMNEVCAVGGTILVSVLGVDGKGRLILSRLAAEGRDPADAANAPGRAGPPAHGSHQ